MLNLCLHFQEFQPIYADKGYAYIGKSVCKENFHQKKTISINLIYIIIPYISSALRSKSGQNQNLAGKV